MRKGTVLILAILVIFHAGATLFAFGHLFGMALMHPSDVNPIEVKVWEGAYFFLTLPLL
jgi:hypothetical protein